MNIFFHKNFKKSYNRLSKQDQKRFEIILESFLENPESKMLGIHRLRGPLEGYYSLDIDYDLRALYEKNDQDILFVKVGTHHQLYGK